MARDGATTAHKTVQETVRSGPELIRATKPYSAEDPATTWRLFATTCAVPLT